MNCPNCKGRLIVKDSRLSDYTDRTHTCSSIAWAEGGENSVGRIRYCTACDDRYVSVETLETKLTKQGTLRANIKQGTILQSYGDGNDTSQTL